MMLLNDIRRNHPLLRSTKVLLLLGVVGMALVLGLLAAKQPVLAISVEALVLIALGTLVWPDVATLVVMFVLFSNAAAIAVQFHGVPYIFGAAVPVLLIIPLASFLIFYRQKLIVNPVLPLLFLYLLVQVAGTLFARNIAAATQNLVKFVMEGVVLYFLVTNVVRTPKMLRLSVWALLLAGAFIGSLMLYQQLTHNMKNTFWGFAQVSNAVFRTGETTVQGDVLQSRLAGMIGENNYTAQAMLMLVPLGLFLAWSERSRLLRVLALATTGMSLVGMALTFSRGAALGFFVMLMIMAFMRYVKPYQIAIIVVGVAVLLVAVPEYGVRIARLQGLQGLVTEGGGTGAAKLDDSDANRANEMLTGLLVFIDHPVIGVGPGLFNAYYQDYAELAGFRVILANRAAHDMYVDIGSESGALGLMCFLATVFVTMRNLTRTRKRYLESRPELANMATGFMLAIITYMTTGIFLSFAFGRYFWLMMALAGAATYIPTLAQEKTPLPPSNYEL